MGLDEALEVLTAEAGKSARTEHDRRIVEALVTVGRDVVMNLQRITFALERIADRG